MPDPTGAPVTSTLPAPNPPASPWRRLMACIYEGVLLFGVVFFFGYAFSAVTRHQNQSAELRWAFQGWIFLVLAVYFVWFWTNGRRTLPMKTVGLRLLAPDGHALSRSRALVRYVAAWATAALPLWVAAQTSYPLSIPLAVALIAVAPLCVLIDHQRRAPWDFVAGTRMVWDASTPQ